MSKPSITFGKIEESGSFFNPAEAQTPTKFARIEEEEKDEVKEEKTVVEPTLILNDLDDVDFDETEVETKDEDEDEEVENKNVEVAESETEEVVKAALDDDETDYKELTIQLIKSGQWERFQPEEGIELEDLDELSKEDFETISKTQAEWKNSEVKSKLFEGLSEDEKQFIDYKKNGGNINTFVQGYLYKQQAQNLDITSDNGKKNTIFAYYKNSTTWSDDRIAKHIQRLEKELELEDEAKMAKSELEERTRLEYEEMLRKQEEYKNLSLEKVKEFKSEVRSNLKTKNYDKKRTDAVLRALTETDERGFAAIDRAFLDFRNDPSKAEIIYNVLLNYDEWIKTVSQEKVNEANLKTFKTIKLNKGNSDVDHDEPYSRKTRNTNKKEYIIELPKKR